MQRVGEGHWRAKLSDRDVELVRLLLLERRMLITVRRRLGDSQGQIDRALCASQLSFRWIAWKFEVSKSLVRYIHQHKRRP